jgi:hypothetical protein
VGRATIHVSAAPATQLDPAAYIVAGLNNKPGHDAQAARRAAPKALALTARRRAR